MVGRVRRYLILNIILRHNFFQSFASIGRVDLVCNTAFDIVPYDMRAASDRDHTRVLKQAAGC